MMPSNDADQGNKDATCMEIVTAPQACPGRALYVSDDPNLQPSQDDRIVDMDAVFR